jgi:nicotinate-nucleotide adenylyltransferase
LFGGAFNPPHRSHHRVLRHAQTALPVSDTIILPTGRHPLKESTDLAPDAARMEFCKIAFQDLPDIRISDFDLLRPGPAYTVDTLSEMQSRFPGRTLFWLLGADNLRSLDQWHQHHQLITTATLVTFPRAGYQITRSELNTLNLSDHEMDTLLAHVLDVEADAVSATSIRAAIARGERPPEVDPAVMDRILELGLYHS